jgi:signal transduction histidine kinase/ligand-binding sensor protein
VDDTNKEVFDVRGERKKRPGSRRYEKIKLKEATAMGADLSKFNASVDDYGRITQLKNILSIADEGILKNLLGGYSEFLSAGIGIYYSEGGPDLASIDTLKDIGSTKDPVEMFREFHPFCAKYRSYENNDKENNKKCIDYDKKITMKYYQGDWDKPTLYRCYMHVFDMTLPIKVEGVLLGVLFAGQIVTAGREAAWRKGLSGLINNKEYHVVWNSDDENIEVPEYYDHKGDIESCLALEMPEQLRTELITVLKDDSKEINLDLLEIEKRFTDFVEFGRMVENLLKQLYEARKDAAVRQLTQAMATYFASADRTSRGAWAKDAEALISSIGSKTNIKNIRVYLRSGEDYEMIVPYRRENRCINAEDVLEAIADMSDRLIRLNRSNKSHELLLNALGFGKENIWVFLAENRTEPTILGSLIVAQGNLENKDIRLAEFFCRTIDGCSNIASLIFRLEDEKGDSENKAEKLRTVLAEASHEYKGPLHNILSLMSLLDSSDSSTHKIRQQMKEEAYRAKRIMDNYLMLGVMGKESLKYNFQLNNIGELARKCASRFELSAAMKGVIIRVLSSATNLPKIAYDSDRIDQVLTNLIDNAVKYSFNNTEIVIEGRDKTNTVTVSVTDMGLGIPFDMRKRIFEGYQRSVEDTQVFKPGTGLGLMIAKQITLAHKGDIDVESKPKWGDQKRLDKNEGFETKFILSLPKNLTVRARG